MRNVNIRDFGAVGDGVTLDTVAIQRSIDACADGGGGRVTLEGGRYLCGFVRLRSFVELRIEADATLLGSADPKDFPDIETDFWKTEFAPRFNRKCFLYGEGLTRIAITGRGQIHCQGATYCEPQPDWEGKHLWKYRRNKPDSPGRMVFLIGCEDVLIEDVSMIEPASGWSYWICDCDRVHFHRIKILSSLHYPNSDGIHINCSRDVTVSDSVIRCGDDAIIVRAYTGVLHQKKPCERITVTNCTLTSYCNAIRIGWINDGIMRDCVFSNLTITNSNGGIGIVLPQGRAERMSDQGDDATLIERITFQNIVIDRHYGEPITVKICDNNLVTAIRDLRFSNIRAVSQYMPSFIGRADARLQDISLSNCDFVCKPVTEHLDDPPGWFCNRGKQELLPFAFVDGLHMQDVTFSV